MLVDGSLAPFSASLQSPLNTSRLYRPLKAAQTHDDASYKTHLLLVESNVKAMFANKHIQMKQLEDALIELQGLVTEGEEGSMAEELSAMAKQLLFKTAAELLAVRGSPSNLSLVPLLCSLSYQAVSCATILDPSMVAWSTYMVIDSLTLMQAIHIDKNAWDSPILGERLVSALLPNEQGLNRLHSRLFQQARDEADQLEPELEALVPRLADNIAPIVGEADVLKVLLLVISRRTENCTFSQVAFFSQLFAHLPRTRDPTENGDLGAEDLAIFLVSLSKAANLGLTTVASQVALTAEQQSLWAAVCTFIYGEKKNNDCGLNIQVRKLLTCVRLKTPTDNLKVLYFVYNWLHGRQFPPAWIQIYAEQIRENITGVDMPSRNTLIPSSGVNAYSADEEQKILMIVLLYLAERALEQGRHREADAYVAEVESNQKNVVELRYQLYKEWLPKASGADELAYVERQLADAETALRSISPPLPPALTSEDSSFASPWPTGQQKSFVPKKPSGDVLSSPNGKSCEESEGGLINNEMPTSPASANSSFASIRSTRECGTSTDNSFVSALASPYQSEGDRTPTTVRSPTSGSPPSATGMSPPEEPIHRQDSIEESVVVVPDESFSINHVEEEESFLMEIICRKMNTIAVALKQSEKAQGDYAIAVANDRFTDMERKMEEMKAEYEHKLKSMEAHLDEEAKKKGSEKNLMQQLGDPLTILRDKFETRKPSLENSRDAKMGESVHPGHSDLCLGCLSDEDQDKALKLLDALSAKWNEEDD